MQRALLFCLAALGALWPATSRAGLRCADLPSPIYVAGSDAAAPLVKALSPLLLQDVDQATVVFQNRGSCAAVEAVAVLAWGFVMTALGTGAGRAVEALFGRMPLPHHLGIILAGAVAVGFALWAVRRARRARTGPGE